MGPFWSPAAICTLLVLSTGMATTQAEEVVLQNRFVRRVLTEQNGIWPTTELARADASDRLVLNSDEFLIRLTDGSEWSVGDFRAAAAPLLEREESSQSLTVRYTPRRKISIEQVVVTYLLADEPYLRKNIRVRLRPEAAVDHLEVERFRTTSPCDRGGRGQPVFVNPAWFFGLEYPGGHSAEHNGLVTLTHYPGTSTLR